MFEDRANKRGEVVNKGTERDVLVKSRIWKYLAYDEGSLVNKRQPTCRGLCARDIFCQMKRSGVAMVDMLDPPLDPIRDEYTTDVSPGKSIDSTIS